jgi:tetratricopeptide (TPR) repeat protein
MAKKPSSKAKRGKRPVEKSAVKGGGIMSINKSNTSPGMKIILIVLIIAFVGLFAGTGLASFVEMLRNPTTNSSTVATGTDAISQIKATYDPQVKALTTAVASDPTSYTLLVNLAEAHLAYAEKLQSTFANQSSQPATSTMTTLAQELGLARDNFKKAVKANKNPLSPDLVDYAITTYYSGDATGAVTIGERVIKSDPTFAPAFYNLGIFYEAVGKKDLAVAAYQKYITLDPKGLRGTPSYAAQQIKALGGSVPSTATAPAP